MPAVVLTSCAALGISPQHCNYHARSRKLPCLRKTYRAIGTLTLTLTLILRSATPERISAPVVELDLHRRGLVRVRLGGGEQRRMALGIQRGAAGDRHAADAAAGAAVAGGPAQLRAAGTRPSSLQAQLVLLRRGQPLGVVIRPSMWDSTRRQIRVQQFQCRCQTKTRIQQDRQRLASRL